MSTKVFYLRSDIMIEPLVAQWYAWSYLIPPATAARNFSHRHLPIIDSYIKAPQLHAAAVKNPKFLGGPFIDYDGGRVEEIAELRRTTVDEATPLFSLSDAIAQLEEMLRTEAKGQSLEPLYARVPEQLRGLVELVYDLNNNASYRLIESLVYQSEFYLTAIQSVLLSITSSDDRPFTLSTPRLPSRDSIQLHIPFADGRIDYLARLKSTPRSLDAIFDNVSLDKEQRSLFCSFLRDVPPRTVIPYTGEGARWKYFGHACILLEAGSCAILFDPVISYAYDTDLHRYTYEDLPERIDYVVITHNHQDHVLLETLLQLRHKIGSIVVPRGSGKLQDPSLRLLLERMGFKNVRELEDLESLDIPSGSITGLPFFGEHADLDIRAKLAYLVRIGEFRFLFAADSCNIEPKLYERVHAYVGDIDVLFLGMECDGAPLSWLYGPLLTKDVDRASDQSRRLSGSNYTQGMDIVERFRCKEVYVYAMGQEPWLNYIMSIKYTELSNPIVQSNRLLKECRQRGVIAERLFGEKEILLNGPV